MQVSEDVCQPQLCVTQQLDQPLPVRPPHKLSHWVWLAAVYRVRGDVEVPAFNQTGNSRAGYVLCSRATILTRHEIQMDLANPLRYLPQYLAIAKPKKHHAVRVRINCAGQVVESAGSCLDTLQLGAQQTHPTTTTALPSDTHCLMRHSNTCKKWVQYVSQHNVRAFALEGMISSCEVFAKQRPSCVCPSQLHCK